MTPEEIVHYLGEVAQSDDPNFAAAAQFVQQTIAQIQIGQLSGSEAAELLEDVQRQVGIMEDMSQMNLKETLNTLINATISIAKMAA